MYLVDDCMECLALAMYYSSDYVTHLSAVMMTIVSSVVMVTGTHGWGLSSRFSLLNSTVHFFIMSRWDHHVFLDLLEC